MRGVNRTYPIKRCMWYKGHVFLLSMVNTFSGVAAMWSTHPFEKSDINEAIPLDTYRRLFQQDHDRQIKAMIIDEWKRDRKRPKEQQSVMDITAMQ